MALNRKSDGELLELALLEIESLKLEIQQLQNQLIEYPLTVPFQDLSNKCSDGGEHDYPNPWHSISPAFCKKCGKQAEQYPITYSNGTGNLPWNFEEHGGNVMNSDNPVVTHDSSKEIKTNYITDTSRLF
jgi:hypothetical protein